MTHIQPIPSNDPISFLAFAKAFPAICDALHTTPQTMQSKRQGKVDAPTRQRLMVAARLSTDGSTTQIGRLFHRDHSTVLHALKVRGQDTQALELAENVGQIVQKCMHMPQEEATPEQAPDTLEALALKIRLRQDQAELAGIEYTPLPKPEATARTRRRRPQRPLLSIDRYSHDNPVQKAEKMLRHSEALDLPTIARLSGVPLTQVRALAGWAQAKGGVQATNGNTYVPAQGAIPAESHRPA